MAPRVLDNRLALVTGAGRGNGAAIARGLARAGARVIVTDIDAQTGARTAADIERAGGHAWSFALDVTSKPDCAALAELTGCEIGPVDLLVNNAGILIRDDIDSPDVAADLERTLQTNAMGTFNVTLAWLAQLRATKGTIVNVGSIAAFSSLGGPISYTPSKGAVKMLTQSLACQLAADGVRVNAIAPGIIATPMTEATRQVPERLARFMARTPLARWAEPEELVGPVIFLSSAMSSYVTGVTLPVDGGFLAG
ncbi:MAG: SDR family oxidoreductase [Betaproteobacteria bacterium]|nr:SDR family oxidoreductase [Betaproteobacteria bacterium]